MASPKKKVILKDLIKSLAKNAIRRWLKCLLLLAVIISTMFVANSVAKNFLEHPDDGEEYLEHYKMSRNLQHYLDSAKLLITPIPKRHGFPEMTMLIMVNSAPSRLAYRNAIRKTWGGYYATFFVLGLEKEHDMSNFARFQIEASDYNDIIMYDFQDHYQNLTIKTALMMKWAVENVKAAYFFKVDDNVIMNRHILNEAIRDKGKEDKIFGYVYRNVHLQRDRFRKWYIPRWLCKQDVIPQFVAAPAYIIRGDVLRLIFTAALHVQMHNLEDVFFTYHVAHIAMGQNLTHDDRFSPYRMQPTWFPFPSCAYWVYATLHQFEPYEIKNHYKKIVALHQRYIRGEEVCSFYKKFIKPIVYMSSTE